MESIRITQFSYSNFHRHSLIENILKTPKIFSLGKETNNRVKIPQYYGTKKKPKHQKEKKERKKRNNRWIEKREKKRKTHFCKKNCNNI